MSTPTARCRGAAWALVAAAFLAACSREPREAAGGGGDATPSDAARAPAWTASVPDRSTRALGRSIDAFGLELYGQLRGRHGNLAVSPASISLAGAMLLAGARGTTAEQLARALHLAQPRAELQPAVAAVLADWSRARNPRARLPDFMRQSPTLSHYYFELALPNRLFVQKGLPLEPAFEELTSRHFAAPVERLDIAAGPEEARRHVNAWVAEQTSGRIADLLPPGRLDASTRLVAANALYLKAGWQSRFLVEDTRDATFMADGARPVTVPMMHGAGTGFAHHQEDELRVLELPLIEPDFTMVILLPDAVDGLPALEERLTQEALSRWLRVEQAPGAVDVRLPRFSIAPSRSMELRRALDALGVEALFDPERCDLRGIARTQPRLVLGEMFHRASVTVNEEGVVATAATAGEAMVGGTGPSGPTFTADHPFLFLIRDQRIGAPLFLGRVTDPSR